MYYQELGPLFLTQNESPLLIQESKEIMGCYYSTWHKRSSIFRDEKLMLDPLVTWLEPTLTPTPATLCPSYLAGAGATLGFSVSMMVSVIIAVTPPDTAELPKPPNPGAFLPCLSASLLACCNSFALRRISAFASRSCV